MSKVGYFCYQILTSVFGIYTSAKFNSAKFSNLFTSEHEILFSEHRKMDQVF